MIPAVLSCVFVAYLYYTLNHEAESRGESAAASSSGGDATADEQLRAMLGRLDSLENRLSRIQPRAGSVAGR